MEFVKIGDIEINRKHEYRHCCHLVRFSDGSIRQLEADEIYNLIKPFKSEDPLYEHIRQWAPETREFNKREMIKTRVEKFKKEFQSYYDKQYSNEIYIKFLDNLAETIENNHTDHIPGIINMIFSVFDLCIKNNIPLPIILNRESIQWLNQTIIKIKYKVNIHRGAITLSAMKQWQQNLNEPTTPTTTTTDPSSFEYEFQLSDGKNGCTKSIELIETYLRREFHI